jgi:hypothetical protein
LPIESLNQTMYLSSQERYQMAAYANYLMLRNGTAVDPITLFHDTYLTGYINYPFSTTWLTALEYDIGHPVEARAVLQTGTDPMGQPVNCWKREYDNGLVVYRPYDQYNRRYAGDNSLVTITLPAGTWYQLWPDGTITGTPSTTIGLRKAESAIFTKAP